MQPVTVTPGSPCSDRPPCHLAGDSLGQYPVPAAAECSLAFDRSYQMTVGACRQVRVDQSLHRAYLIAIADDLDRCVPEVIWALE